MKKREFNWADASIRVAFWILLLLYAFASVSAQNKTYKVHGNTVESVMRQKRVSQHDSTTQWHYKQGEKVVPVYVGRKGGLYYWLNGKKHYLPKAVKAQLQAKRK